MVENYHALSKELPREIFKPYPLRLLTLFFSTLTWASSFAAIVMIPMHWPLKLFLGLVVGSCWGINGFIAHELLHGSVIRSKKWQDFLGFFALMPYLISPTFWRYWHNRLHHSHTQKIVLDPDAYPTYRIFKHSKFSRWMYPVTPGSGYKRSYFYFFFWFSVNVIVAQVYFRFRNKLFDKLDHKKVNAELLLQFLLFASMMVWAGPWNLLWVWVIPFTMQNYFVFSYISTNHNLSPLTKENDPLVNSLTVTNHPFLEFFHLNFGYHVEHHIFPTMSPKRIKPVHELLKKKYPDRFHYMSKWQAIKALYSTARIYKNSTTLLNPLTGKTYPTIASPKVLTTKDVADKLNDSPSSNPIQSPPPSL